MPHRRTRLVNAAARAERDARIFTLMQQGWTYDAIAQKEAVSRERVRQIINQTLKSRGGEPDGLHQRLQLARLDPALWLAAAKVAEGDLRAIDKLVRVINQIDKYRARPAGRRVGFIGERQESDEEAHERILRKLNEPYDPDEAPDDDMEEEQDEDWEGGESPRERLLRKLAEVDARCAAFAADEAEEAAQAATSGGPETPADDSVSKFSAR
jgi:hypothetical protein